MKHVTWEELMKESHLMTIGAMGERDRICDNDCQHKGSAEMSSL